MQHLYTLWIAAVLLPVALAAQDRPNVLLIVADDLGVHDLSLYGGPVPTPHLDRLAGSGAAFSRAYATASICSPSRMGILTGQYQQRLGFEFQPHQRYPRNFVERWAAHYLLGRDGWKPAPGPKPSSKSALRSGIPGEARTLAETFRENGYRTGLLGKWHLGYHPERHPLRHGFEHFYGFLEAYSLYGDKRDTALVHAPVRLFADRVQWKARKGPRAIEANGNTVAESRYLTGAITEEAIRFMEQGGEAPFFGYLAYSAPHAPWQAPKAIYDTLGYIEDHHRRVYYAMVIALDDAVGKLLDYLDARQLRDNTLIVFTSDNGVATYNGHVGSGALKGGKFTFFEGGLNVPFFLSWPGAIAPGQHWAAPVSHLDIAPTLAAALAQAPAGDSDGLSLLPLLQGQATDTALWERPLFWRSGFVSAVRQGAYKLILDKSRQQVWLYDLSADPVETRNLRAEQPEKVSTLLAALEGWESRLLPPAWPHAINYEVVIDGEKYYFAI